MVCGNECSCRRCLLGPHAECAHTLVSSLTAQAQTRKARQGLCTSRSRRAEPATRKGGHGAHMYQRHTIEVPSMMKRSLHTQKD